VLRRELKASSPRLVYLPIPAVAYKRQPNPVIGIGLAVAEVAVGTVDLGRTSVKQGVFGLLGLRNRRSSEDCG
jgi:hypothetical protein